MMTQKQFDEMMENWLARQAEKGTNPWGKMPEAQRMGITDGSRPQSFATREEAATMIMAALKHWTDEAIRIVKNS